MTFTSPNTTDLVDRLEQDHLGRTLDTGDFTRVRAKGVRNLQNAVNYLWHHRDWDWSMDNGTVVVAANAELVLPTNVQWLAKEGGIWISTPAQRPPLSWIPFHRYLDLLKARGKSGEPVYYTKANQVTGQAETQYILLYPTNDQSRTFSWAGKVRAPRAVDDEGSDDEIWQIPQAWRETVLYELLVYYEMKDTANIQSRTDQLGVVQMHLENMIIEERPGRNTAHHLAPFGRRRLARRI